MRKATSAGKAQYIFLALLAAFCVATSALPPLCFAQQAAASAIVTGTEQLLVNWFYGAYVPKDVPLTPLTFERRVKLYERQTFTTPGIYLRSGFVGLVDQARSDPYEWGGGFTGYSRRFASTYGQDLIQNTLSTAGNAALHYEPRYDRCRCSGLWPRTRHAVMRNFLTYNKSEKESRPQFALYGAAFTAGAISNTWRPQTDALHLGYQGMLTQAEFGILSNWVGEFAPEIVRILKLNRAHAVRN